MQANSRCRNYASLIWPSESGNSGKEGKRKIKKDWISWERKEFLDEIIPIFRNFWNAMYIKNRVDKLQNKTCQSSV